MRLHDVISKADESLMEETSCGKHKTKIGRTKFSFHFSFKSDIYTSHRTHPSALFLFGGWAPTAGLSSSGLQ